MIRFSIFFIILMLMGCSKDKISGSDDSGDSNDSSSDSSESAELVELSEIISNPSDQFIVDSDGLAKVSRSHPYMGSSESCAHAGAHLHFTTDDAPYLINIYAPADGVISGIDKCYDLGNGNDKYSVNLIFATHEGSNVSLNLSLEPFAGYLCQDDEDYYSQYILVENGQSVEKGDLIAKLYKPDSGDDSTHIHFHVNFDSSIRCPNIFTSSIVSDFADTYGGTTCDGEEFGETLCYNPAEGEDLTGL